MELTSEQIRQFLKWVDTLSMFRWDHVGNEPVIPDIKAVYDWLTKKARDEHGLEENR